MPQIPNYLAMNPEDPFNLEASLLEATKAKTKEEKSKQKALSPDGKSNPPSNMGAMILPNTKMLTPQEEKDAQIWDWMRSNVKNLLSEERSGIEQQGQDLQNMKQLPLGVDFRPLASFVGTMVKGGEDLAKAFPEVDTPEKRAKKIQELENLLQNQRGDLSKNAIMLLRAEMDKQKDRNKRFEEAQLTKKETELQKDLEKRIFTPMDEYNTIMSNMEDQISRGTISSIGTAISNYARAVGGQKGVLTDQDVNLMLPKNLLSTIARAEAWVTSNPNVPLPKEVSQALQREMEISRQNTRRIFEQKLNTAKNIYSTRQSFRDVMNPLTGFGPKAFEEVARRVSTFAPSKKKETSQLPGGVMSIDEFLKQGK